MCKIEVVGETSLMALPPFSSQSELTLLGAEQFREGGVFLRLARGASGHVGDGVVFRSSSTLRAS